MERIERVAALVVPLLIGALVLALLAARAEASAEGDVIAKINRFRADHGLRTLEVSSSLMRSAEAYSDTMMDRQYFGHANRIQASSKYRRLGEILEWHRGRNPDPGWAMRDWVHSPPHLQVILDPLFTYIGAGYVTGRFFGHRNTIWTVHFGRR
jgi:uncharacterized protein YkwD